MPRPTREGRTHTAVFMVSLILVCLLVSLASCASFQGDGQSYWRPIPNPYPTTGDRSGVGSNPNANVQPVLSSPPPLRATEDPSVVALRTKLVEGARAVLGKRELIIRGRSFCMDCTGTVLAIYWYAGIDLAQDFPKIKGDGVSRVYQTLERRGLLYSTAHPLSGDIIFWDDTYDQEDSEGRPNPLSHMGMVVSVDPAGTICYVHYHIRRGITIDSMNLENPNVESRIENGSLKVINSPLRLAIPGQPHPARWLAGQLYRVMGIGYLLE